MNKNSNLRETALVFLKLGCTAFGGPAVHIAMMEDEIVSRRKWMSREHFLDLISVTNLIPGPNSTEMTMHCGRERAGIAGLFTAGLCFILPASLITLFFAVFYDKYGSLPEAAPFINGIKSAVLAIIASAIIKFAQKAVKGWEIGVLGLMVLASSLAGLNEIFSLFVAGITGILYFSIKNKFSSRVFTFIPIVFFHSAVFPNIKLKLSSIFLIFLKIGALLYGSGYVLYAYLNAELSGWISKSCLIDSVAVGQFTPGPVLSAASFIGYQLGGYKGAAAAAAGIFLPSFIFVLIVNPFIPKMRKSKILNYFLDSVNIAAAAVMAGVLFKMSASALVDWKSILIAILACAAVFGIKKISYVYLVLGGALTGYILSFI